MIQWFTPTIRLLPESTPRHRFRRRPKYRTLNSTNQESSLTIQVVRNPPLRFQLVDVQNHGILNLPATSFDPGESPATLPDSYARYFFRWSARFRDKARIPLIHSDARICKGSSTVNFFYQATGAIFPEVPMMTIRSSIKTVWCEISKAFRQAVDI